jgi:hypothetical protein
LAESREVDVGIEVEVGFVFWRSSPFDIDSAESLCDETGPGENHLEKLLFNPPNSPFCPIWFWLSLPFEAFPFDGLSYGFFSWC